MQLSQEQVRHFRTHGYLILDQLFSPEEAVAFQEAFRRDSRIPGEHRVLEQDGEEVRAVYASHVRQSEFAGLIRSPRVLGPVRQLLDSEAYIYQFKINSKAPFAGAGWSWHQDFAAWQMADNLAAPRLVNVGVFLDDVTEFNGPVIFCPGSHRDGLVKKGRTAASAASDQHVDPEDISLTAADMTALVDRHGLISAKGPAGSVVLFDPEIVHGSASNMAPFPRRLLIVTYNDVTNVPVPLGEPRPAYVVGRDTAPLEMSGQETATTMEVLV
ncbi:MULTISPECIES: phytanoyl-CoA dioxygenase family protein [Streptomyces]|uniref:phytanoyl-CoA dioxygenase family protein n=1 Tax=Streptomyces TaxID=1883 RepID=UPI000D509209|nr:MULTISPECIES: phytanoyl-CoA dioxygenase family protein [Streptomyces]MXG28329.1 phytanoyl-CoA dioxygenase [Streptomyces sp. YIM 132580]PVC67126.1 phytanoyl-CoA dioxygenase [Streptomyces sp. CS065A]